MSLRVDKDNIYFVLPESRYSVSKRIDKYMEEDFTLFIKTKIIYPSNKIFEIESQRITTYGGNYTFYKEQKALHARGVKKQLDLAREKLEAMYSRIQPKTCLQIPHLKRKFPRFKQRLPFMVWK